MASSTPTTEEWESFAQSAQLALQRLRQAQMSLAFLGDNERAHHVTSQLNQVAELVHSMQTRHATLVAVHEDLQDRIDEGISYWLQGDLMVEPIDGEQPQTGRRKRLAVIWNRLRRLTPIAVTICVLVAVAILVRGPRLGSANPSGTLQSATRVAHIGDTLSAGMINCTLLGVDVGSLKQHDGQHEYASSSLTVRIRLHNTASSWVSYNQADFHLKTGTKDDMNEQAAISSSFGSGELAPGDSVEGEVVFKVVGENRDMELTWQPLLWGDATEHAWLLDLS